MGAALLMAMLTVTLIATFAAAALWQQWRSAEVEAAERARMQSAWVLIGALAWSRLILQTDAQTDRSTGRTVDNLTEPWAVPLEEAKLTAFLSADKNIASDALDGLPDAFLSGRIVDAQSKLNVRNLVVDTAFTPSEKDVGAFNRLFSMLGLPAQQVNLLTTGVQQALATSTSSTSGSDGDSQGNSSGANAPLMPLQEDQLTWFGLSPSTVAALAPYVTVLPKRTTLNVNTASAEVLAASVPSLGLSGAKLLTLQRMSTVFTSLPSSSFNAGEHGTSTEFFEVLGRLRLDDVWVEERSLLDRSNGITLTILWRQRGAGTTTVDAKQ
ncbi:type II secretion system minor pseudopilin GspK [soil metagenome]